MRKRPLARKSAKSSKSLKAKPLAARPLAAKEVVELAQQLEAEYKSDLTWRAMTAAEPAEGDHWTDVEEHLLRRHHDEDQKLKRWKHFG